MNLKAVTFLVYIVALVQGFYLPGVAPKNFKKEDLVELKVIKLTSIQTQLPLEFYKLPFCKPAEIQSKPENIGEILRGDRIENSNYVIKALVDEPCQVLKPCEVDYNATQLKQFSDAIDQGYQIEWRIDNLPGAQPKLLSDGETEKTVYEAGFPVGKKWNEVEGGTEGVNFIYNHHNMILHYHEDPSYDGAVRIVGFEVEPRSIKHDLSDYQPDSANWAPKTCDGAITHAPQPVNGESQKILFTYSVKWKPSETPWSQRWEPYLVNTDPQIHWFSIINSLMIVLFLSGMVAMIMMRTLHADIRRYNQMEPNDEVEETGWKLVHGDVFRPPLRPMILSVLIGSGVQVFSMALITMVFAVLGFLSPANQGGLSTVMIVMFMIMGGFAGYFSTRSYKTLKGTNFKRNAVLTALFLPGIIFLISFFVNFFVWSQESSGAVPFGTIMALFGLWIGILVPLVFIGAYFAWKKPIPDPPVSTNQIPRQIPDQVWYMHPILSILMGGILPFGAVFIELFFILSAIWEHHFYYIFSFLFIVFIILILTSAEITVVMCYFQLCSEDYHWWWRSFMTSGAAAFYMFLYSIFYFFTKLHIHSFISGLLYFSYSFMMALLFFCLTGAIGFYACLFFVRKIYGAIKVE